MTPLMERHAARTAVFQERLGEAGVDLAVLTDPDSIYYLGGYWGYLGMDFGRPTAMLVPRQGAPSIVTPLMESEMARRMTWLDDVVAWEDGRGDEWRGALSRRIEATGIETLGVERLKTPGQVAEYLADAHADLPFADISPILGEMRMVKSAEEIAEMRQAGAVAVAMTEAAEAAIGVGVPEYEVALAVIAGGTRKAAEILEAEGWTGDEAPFHCPTIYNLQILQSGHHTCMVHRRSTVRRIAAGEPVYLCYCGIANFKQFKLGFDRQYFVGHAPEEMARHYEITLAAQKAALDAIRPGVPAEEPHFAAADVYRQAGLAPGYRTGRAIGYSFLEAPEIKEGDTTPLAAGMTFAVDGGITLPGRFGTRVGDSIVVTEDGFDYLTPYPKELRVLG
ncbi:MAG: Xaa-Pro peptidase family protein [Rhodovibrionaceae bacterium]|nr:Xaa-Pro peptidase family protein [Rhodovibrionaceae bacterium]